MARCDTSTPVTATHFSKNLWVNCARLNEGENFPIGFSVDATYTAVTVSLPEHGQLVVVSDGIVEQRNTAAKTQSLASNLVSSGCASRRDSAGFAPNLTPHVSTPSSNTLAQINTV